MQRVIIALAIVCAVLAQPTPNPQPGQLSPSVIYNNQAVVGALLPTTSGYAANVILYAIYVPENASSVTVFFNSTSNSDYCDLQFFLRTGMNGGLPCNPDQFDDYDSDSYQCTLGTTGYSDYDEDYEDTYEYDNYNGGDEGVFRFTVLDWWYFAVARSDDDYFSETCAFELKVDMAINCSGNSVGQNEDDYATDLDCETYTNISSGYATSVATQGANGFQELYKIYIPTATVSRIDISFSVSNSEDWYVLGVNYAAPSDEIYTCNDDGIWTYDENAETYSGVLTCYLPRIGNFYFILQNDDSGVNGTFSVNYTTCANDMAGIYCNATAVPLNTNGTGQSFVVSDDTYAYLYLDIPANYTGGDLAIYADATYSGPDNDGYGNLYLRKGGMPSDDDYGTDNSYESMEFPALFVLNNFDFYVSGRWWVALECEDATTCNMTVTVTTVSSSVVTTGMSGAAVTTGKGGAAVTTGMMMNTTATTRINTSGMMMNTTLTTKSVTSHAPVVATSGSTTRAATTGSKTNSASFVAPSFLAIAIIAIMNLF